MTLAIKGLCTYSEPDRPRLVGVYILMRGDVVVYVGQSVDIALRMTAHRSRRNRRSKHRRWNYDCELYIPTAVEDLKAYEGALVRALNPSHTFKCSPNRGRDGEILSALGLAPDETRSWERRMSEKNGAVGRALRASNRRRKRNRAVKAKRVALFIAA